jgi:hypothetical protein
MRPNNIGLAPIKADDLITAKPTKRQRMGWIRLCYGQVWQINLPKDANLPVKMLKNLANST